MKKSIRLILLLCLNLFIINQIVLNNVVAQEESDFIDSFSVQNNTIIYSGINYTTLSWNFNDDNYNFTNINNFTIYSVSDFGERILISYSGDINNINAIQYDFYDELDKYDVVIDNNLQYNFTIIFSFRETISSDIQNIEFNYKWTLKANPFDIIEKLIYSILLLITLCSAMIVFTWYYKNKYSCNRKFNAFKDNCIYQKSKNPIKESKVLLEIERDDDLDDE